MSVATHWNQFIRVPAVSVHSEVVARQVVAQRVKATCRAQLANGSNAAFFQKARHRQTHWAAWLKLFDANDLVKPASQPTKWHKT